MYRVLVFALVILFSVLSAAQSTSNPSILPASDLNKVLPSSFFFRGVSASTQPRNSSALKYSDGFYVITGLVDTTGYSSDIKAKYIGFFITEKTLSIGGKTLPPGQYGMGFIGDSKFHIMDVAANELLSVDAPKDTKMAHPVPLKFVLENGETKLYLGRSSVTFAAQ